MGGCEEVEVVDMVKRKGREERSRSRRSGEGVDIALFGSKIRDMGKEIHCKR